MTRFVPSWVGAGIVAGLGLAGAAAAADAPVVKTVTLCPAAGPGCAYTSLAQALGAARPGTVVVLTPGRYREAGVLWASRVTVRALPGALIEGAAAEDKAALVVKGDDTLIEGVDCSGIAVPDRNGACVRLEGHGLTLRRVHFHDSEEGLLTGSNNGTVTIEDSRFERLGANGRAHGVYAGPIDALVIRRSFFLSSKEEGHEVKSRAARTVIESSVIASLDGRDSRLIDASNGGELTVRDSLLEIGPASVNQDMIGFGLEGLKYQHNVVTLRNCTLIVDRGEARLLAGPPAGMTVIRSNNRVIGGPKSAADGMPWFPDRAAAGFPAYPSFGDWAASGPSSSDAHGQPQ